MGDLLLQTVFEIIWLVIRFLFILPGELAIEKAAGWDSSTHWFRDLLAFLVSLFFWIVVGFAIYFLTRALA